MATNPQMTPLQQAVASNNANNFARMQDKILPETWELNRWLLASLLAINSAACAAMYGKSGLSYDTIQSSGWCFISGALAALGSGFVLTFVLARLDKVATDAQFYWAAVTGGHPRSQTEEDRFATQARNRFSWTPQFLLYASAALFLAGIVQL